MLWHRRCVPVLALAKWRKKEGMQSEEECKEEIAERNCRKEKMKADVK